MCEKGVIYCPHKASSPVLQPVPCSDAWLSFPYSWILLRLDGLGGGAQSHLLSGHMDARDVYLSKSWGFPPTTQQRASSQS